jgi:subtilisin family serine protease
MSTLGHDKSTTWLIARRIVQPIVQLIMRLALLVALFCGARVAHADDFIPARVLIQGDEKGQATAVVKLGDAGYPITFVNDYPAFSISLYKFNNTLTAADVPLVRVALDDLVSSGAIIAGDFDIPVSIERGQGQTGSIWVSCLGLTDFEGQYGVTTTGAPFAADAAHGRDVKIALIDSGLVPNAPTSEYFALTYGYVCLGGFSTFGATPRDIGNGIDENNNNAPDEAVGHGTYIAGLISRVAPGARHLHMKVLDDEGGCFLSDVTVALQQCIYESVHVVNLSLIPLQPTNILANEIKAVRDNGAILVASAGNTGDSINRYLGSEVDLVQVGASDANDAVWAQSATGTWVDVFAPGTTVVDAVGLPVPGQSLLGPIGFDAVTQSPCYAGASGTSFAAAWVTGVAACYRAANPEWPNTLVPAPQITTNFVSQLLASSVSPPGSQIKRLDAAAFVSTLTPVPHCPPDLVRNPSFPYQYQVDAQDLAALLSAWGVGLGHPLQINRADINGDGSINAGDLSILLSAWGTNPPPCP